MEVEGVLTGPVNADAEIMMEDLVQKYHVSQGVTSTSIPLSAFGFEGPSSVTPNADAMHKGNSNIHSATSFEVIW